MPISHSVHGASIINQLGWTWTLRFPGSSGCRGKIVYTQKLKYMAKHIFLAQSLFYSFCFILIVIDETLSIIIFHDFD